MVIYNLYLLCNLKCYVRKFDLGQKKITEILRVPDLNGILCLFL